MLKNYKNILNKLFFLISLVFAVWQLGTFMMFISITNEQIIFWDRFVYLGVVFMPAFQYHFSLIITYFNKRRKKLLISAYILSLAFLLLSRTDYFVNNVFRYKWGVHAEAKILHHFFLAFFFFYIFALLFNFYKQYKKSNLSSEKYRLIYFVVSFSILNLVGGIGYLPAYKVSIFSPVSLLAPLAFSILIAYAIVRHRLMDIKLVARKYSVYLFSLFSIAIPAFLVKIVIDQFFFTISYWVDLLILIAAVSLFPPLKNYYYRLANRYFFSSLYDSSDVVAEVSDRLRSLLDIKTIYNFIAGTLISVFHVKTLGILTYDEKTGEYVLQYNSGLNTGGQKRFKEDKNLQKAYADKHDPIVVEELKKTSYDKYKEILDLLTALGVEALVPLDVKDKIIGLIVLGPKESGDMYNDEDLQVLKVIGAQSAVTMENALLYEETRKFGIKLQKEVQMATTELRVANEQLKKLDEAKSDFISIASHQLRTPLTAIKGYVSMILEGDFGKITAEEKESLEKVFDSTERLIRLVEDLLNISRIESGRLQFSFTEVRLEEMVDSVMEELANNAKKKGLKLLYNKPQKALPKVKIDEEKARQVVMNLIDNAIKYTKKGSVSVSVSQADKNIEFCVADTGMGIKKDDLPHLFQKFSRGTGISLIHTEGTGLGLYVARMMMEAHGGRIWAESEGEGRGSKFCFSLPIN